MSVTAYVLVMTLIIELDMFGQNVATDIVRDHEGLVNLSSVVIPSGSGITNIYLNNNNFVQIPQGYFTNLDFPHLETIHLGTNQISHLDNNWLLGVTSLQKLYLVANKLKIIRNETFSGLINLRILTLNNNEVSSVNSRIRSKSPQWESLTKH